MWCRFEVGEEFREKGGQCGEQKLQPELEQKNRHKQDLPTTKICTEVKLSEV